MNLLFYYFLLFNITLISSDSNEVGIIKGWLLYMGEESIILGTIFFFKSKLYLMVPLRDRDKSIIYSVYTLFNNAL